MSDGTSQATILRLRRQRILMVVVKVLYSAFGAFNLAALIAWFTLINKAEDTFHAHFQMLLNFSWAIMSFLTVYALWKLKRWGRYLAIALNVFVLLAVIPDLLFALISDQVREIYPGSLMLRQILGIILLGLITSFLLREDVKELMQN